MTWKKLRTYQDMLGLGTVLSTPNTWLARTLHQIVGIDAQTLNIRYRLDKINEVVVYGDQSLSFVKGTAVASTWLGSYETRAFLFGFDPDTGQVRWQTRVFWTGPNTGQFGGFSATDDTILLTEQPVSTPQLVWLDPVTGEKKHRCDSVNTKTAPLVAGNHIFIAGYWDVSGLFRTTLAPTHDAVEKIQDGEILSITVQDDHVFVLYTEGEWEKERAFVVCYQADSLDVLGKIEIAPENEYTYVDLHAFGHPDRVLAYGKEELYCYDTAAKKLIWQQKMPYRRYTNLDVTSWGAMIPFGSNEHALLIDYESGTLSQWDRSEWTSDHFNELDDHLLVTEGSSASLWTEKPTVNQEVMIDEGKDNVIDITSMVKNDAPKDPREILRDAFGAATRKGKLDPALEKMREIFPTNRIAGKVKTFLEAAMKGDIPKGPLNFTSWDRLAGHCFRYPELFGFGDKERFFPALLVASEYGGVEFYMMLSSGKVIALHHDASFSEVASDVWAQVGEDPTAFEKAFPKEGAVHTIDQLLAFQNEFAGIKMENLDDIPPQDLIPRLAEAFGWTIKKLASSMDLLPMEFLYWHVMDHEEVLQALIEKEKQNK